MSRSGAARADEEPYRAQLAPVLEPFAPKGLRPREVVEVGAALAPHAELPAAYRAFLRMAGRGCGSLWIGSDVHHPLLLGQREATEELLAEDGGRRRLAADDVPFLLHQGYDAWYLHGSGPDPEVWQYHEGLDDRPRRLADRFTLFVVAQVQQHAELAVDRFVSGWLGLRHEALVRTDTASTLDLVRAVEAGRLAAAAPYLRRGDRYEVGPGPIVTLVASPTYGPEGKQYSITVDPTTGTETFTAAAVHAQTASYDRGRRTVPLVHLERAMDRMAADGRLARRRDGAFIVPDRD